VAVREAVEDCHKLDGEPPGLAAVPNRNHGDVACFERVIVYLIAQLYV